MEDLSYGSWAVRFIREVRAPTPMTIYSNLITSLTLIHNLKFVTQVVHQQLRMRPIRATVNHWWFSFRKRILPRDVEEPVHSNIVTQVLRQLMRNRSLCIDCLFQKKDFSEIYLPRDVGEPSSFKVCNPSTASANTQQMHSIFDNLPDPIRSWRQKPCPH